MCRHHHTDVKSGEVLLSTKHFWSLTAKKYCSILLNNWYRWVYILKWKKKQWQLKIKWLSTARHSESKPSLWQAADPVHRLQMWCDTFSLAATVKMFSFKNGVNNFFSNQFGISGLFARERAVWRYFVFFSLLPILFHFKTSAHLHQFLKEYCNIVLQWSSRNVFWTTKLHPTFHWHGGEQIITEYPFLGELIL